MARSGRIRRAVPPSLVLFAGAFLLAAVICPLIGSPRLVLGDVIADLAGRGGHAADILFRYRIPRVILALLVGGTLATVGATFQVVLRNPLAEPYTLGATAGPPSGLCSRSACQACGFKWGHSARCSFWPSSGRPRRSASSTPSPCIRRASR